MASDQYGIRAAFPELDKIDSEEIREKVYQVWSYALDENGYESVNDVHFYPPGGDGIGDAGNTQHVRDTTISAIELAEIFTNRRDVEIDLDAVIAGALLHDASKPFEYTPAGVETELNRYVSHPYFIVHLLAKFGLSLHIQHIALAHSSFTAVQPRTFEAKLVAMADEISVNAIWWEMKGELLSEESLSG